MNKYNVNYSMTTYIKGNWEYTIVNKRVGKDWYIYSEYPILGSRQHSILQRRDVVIYSYNDNLLAIVETVEGKKIASYYEIAFMYKNTVDVLYLGCSDEYSKLNGYLYFAIGQTCTLELTVFDVDETKGTIAVRYNGDDKIVVFKRTDKYKGKEFLIGL
jgi:hypothetical protein